MEEVCIQPFLPTLRVFTERICVCPSYHDDFFMQAGVVVLIIG